MSTLRTLLFLAATQALPSSVLPPPVDPVSTLSPAQLEALGQWIDTSNQQQMVEALLDHHAEYVRTRYKDRLAFVSIERQPDLHLRVGLKGEEKEPDLHLPIAGTTIRVKVETGYPYTQDEFRAVLEKVRPTIETLIPDVTGIAGRPELNLIEIHVQGTNEQHYQHALAQIESLAGLKAKVRLGTSRPRDLL